MWLLSRDVTAHGKNFSDLKEIITKCCTGDCHHGNYNTDLFWVAFIVQCTVFLMGEKDSHLGILGGVASLAAKVIRNLLQLR